MTSATASFYNRIAFMYPIIDVFLKPQKRNLVGEVNAYPPGRLLEIGVGTGSHLRNYRKHSIVGIDISQTMLNYALRNNPDNAILLQMDGESLIFGDETFDYVVLSHVLAVTANADRLLEEVQRVLAPGGTLFILNHFTPKNWVRYIDNGFALFSRRFHFRSAFRVEDLSTLKSFKLMKDASVCPLSYFRLLVYTKS